MNPLILVGFDLAVSAALILVAMYVVWSRVQSRLESLGVKEEPEAVEFSVRDRTEPERPVTEAPAAEWAFGGVTEQAANLKQKGCSMEQIAQRLQLPTREVEMMLAISEMAKVGKAGGGLHVPFPLEPEEAVSC